MDERRVALIVAVDEYADASLRRLAAPTADAQALAEALADAELGAFEVNVLINEPSYAIRQRVERFFVERKPSDLALLHFSCHGLKDDSGELFLASPDTLPTLLSSTAVDAAFVNRLMRRSRARRAVLLLDCCYGGAFERGMVARAGGAVDVGSQFEQQQLAGGRGRAVITASSAVEYAFEDAQLVENVDARPSLFTGAFVEGLTTGNADRDHDGRVSLNELYEYVYDRVQEQTPSQTPSKWEFGVQGELMIARNPRLQVVPVAPPGELVELTSHPVTASRFGAVDELGRLAAGANLPVAAGARETLKSMIDDDSRRVSASAVEALERTRLELSTDAVDFGRMTVDDDPPVMVVDIAGPPLATASHPTSSLPNVSVRRVDRTLQIKQGTSVAGKFDGVITVTGPAGDAHISVRATVIGKTAEPVAPPPEAQTANTTGEKRATAEVTTARSTGMPRPKMRGDSRGDYSDTADAKSDVLEDRDGRRNERLVSRSEPSEIGNRDSPPQAQGPRDAREAYERNYRKYFTAIGVVVALAAIIAILIANDRSPTSSLASRSDDSANAAPGNPGGTSLQNVNLTVGSKDFDEQQILGYLSVTALENAGANVTDQVNLGGTDANRQALLSGEIQHYWEYTGTGWINHLGHTDPIPDREEQYEAVKDEDLQQNNLVWLEPTLFNNTYGLAFRSEASGDLGNPETLSDLGDLIENDPDQASLCVETEFESREDGLPGMEEAYGYEFPDNNITTLDTGVIYSAIDSGDPCNFGEIFTTDGRIAALDLTVLEDDEAFFPFYNASPVFARDVYEQYGEALDACFGPIAEALDQDTMTELNMRVSSDGERPQDVARSFLDDNNLLQNCS